MAYISIDIDLGDVYKDLSTREKENLVYWLEEDGYLPKENVSNYDGMMNDEFTEVCAKIVQSYYRMDHDDIETITKLMKKYEFFV